MTDEQKKAALKMVKTGIVMCQCYVSTKHGDRRPCKKRADRLNKTGAFLFSCRWHEYVDAG